LFAFLLNTAIAGNLDHCLKAE